MLRVNKTALGALLSIVLLVGCTGGSSVDQSIANTNKSNMERLANLYVRFQTQNNWRGPKDEAEFKEYLNSVPGTTLERMGVTGSIEDLFVSESDDAPFKIRYGVRGSARGTNDAIIFEQEGDGGKRRVGFTSRNIEEVEDDARYNGLLDGSIKVPLAAPRAKMPKTN